MIQDKLLEKSKEAFVMAIEIYNKPTIKYRVEGFSFFICNAWELMLKAHMINKFGEDSIYYKDNKERTITLENCLQKVITNKKECGGNRQWQNHYLRNWAANTKGKGII